MKEGITRYRLDHIDKEIPFIFEEFPEAEAKMQELIQTRDRLRKLELIGEANDIGYGNASVLVSQPHSSVFAPLFLVSGTQTGHIQNSKPSDYALVRNANPEEFMMQSEGPVRPSSEALTHATIYLLESRARAVLHIHHYEFWKWLINSGAKSTGDAEYGSREMIESIRMLLDSSESSKSESSKSESSKSESSKSESSKSAGAKSGRSDGGEADQKSIADSSRPVDRDACDLYVMPGHESGVIAWGTSLAVAEKILVQTFHEAMG